MTTIFRHVYLDGQRLDVPTSYPPIDETSSVVDVDRLLTGPDTLDPMTELQTLFNSGILDGRHIVFGATGRRYVFQTRPTSLGPQSQYLTPPQKCILEWAPGCEWDFSAYGAVSGGGVVYMRRDGAYGAVRATTGDIAKSDRTITAAPGVDVSDLVYGQRLVLRATTGLATLTGSFTLLNSSAEITASISGTTLTVTAATSALVVGSEITASGVTANTVITAFGNGTGLTGTYTISPSHGTVTSRTMLASNPLLSARSEDLIVRDVVGQVITFLNYIQDDYPGTVTPVLQTYEDEPEITLINPTVYGAQPLVDPTTSDNRFFHINRCRNFRVIGGRVDYFPESIIVRSSLGGEIDGTVFHGIREGQTGGGMSIGDATTDFTVRNCVYRGGGQVFNMSGSGFLYGVARDIKFINCDAYGALSGFSGHNMQERISYLDCMVNDPQNEGFDIRSRGSVVSNCTVLRAGRAALLLRVAANDLVVENFRAEDCFGGVQIEDSSTAWDYPPHNIIIRNSNFERNGSGGALDFRWEPDPDGAEFEDLQFTGNTISAINTAHPVQVRGPWKRPIITGNRFLFPTGVSSGGTCIYLDAGDDAFAFPGPIDPVVRDNIQVPGYSVPLVVRCTGKVINERHTVLGTNSTQSILAGGATTLIASQSGEVLRNAGASSTATVTLPAPNFNYPTTFKFIVASAFFGITVVTNTGTVKIQTGGDAGTIGVSYASTTLGSWLRVTMVSNTLWMAEVDDPANWVIT